MQSSPVQPREFNWPVALFIVGYHAALLLGLPFYLVLSPPSAGLVVTSVLLLFLTEIGIGASYHRFYAHRSYTAARPAEAGLLALATLAIQGSALQWSFEHRLHHSHVDTDEDPYSIKKGFWYAHMLWMFEKGRPVDLSRVPDLAANPLVMFQHRYYGLLCFGGNAALCLLLGWLHADLLGAFVLAWWTRLLVSHHLTWFVNSLAHTWGEQTYSREQSAVDNYILAFLTVGEGYHNYHHTFAADYRNGHRWYHFDPTKWTIWALSKLGQTWDLRRYSRYKVRRRLLQEDKKLLLEALAHRAHRRKASLERRIHRVAGRAQEKLARLTAFADELNQLRQARAARGEVRAARRQLRVLEGKLRRDFRVWTRLCSLVLTAAPAAAA